MALGTVLVILYSAGGGNGDGACNIVFRMPRVEYKALAISKK